MSRNVLYIAVMALVSYTIRVLPLTLIRKPIRNTFIQSFLYYVPYVTLAVMTFPAILHAFYAYRVCVKCAQTQISRLNNFYFSIFISRF